MSRFSQFRASRFGQSRFRTREFRGGASLNVIAALFANGEQGAWYDPSDLSTLFQDAAGTTPVAAVGDPVGRLSDLSGNGNNTTQEVSTRRPTYQITGAGVPFIRHDLVDDGLEFLLPGSYSGGRAFSTPLAHQVDKSVPLAGFTQELPKVDLTSFVARAGTFTDDEASRVSQSMFGGRQFMVTMTDDLTLANLRMYMNNGETPVIRAIGANGAEATVALGDAATRTLDLGAAGLTAPVTVLFPVVEDATALVNFYCYGNNLTGSIPDLSMNTALVGFYCNSNNLTGSIPDLSMNTALVGFWCHGNNLTGSIPDLSMNTALAYFYCYGNNLTGSIPDLSMNTALANFYCSANNLTGWAGGTLPASIVDFRADNNSLSQAAVDGILAALDAAGASGGTCRLEGGTNAAPSTAGQTSIVNLRARGWTVIVTGGY